MGLDNERSRVAHLLRRAGFGGSEAEVDEWFSRQARQMRELDVCMGAMIEKATGKLIGLAVDDPQRRGAGQHALAQPQRALDPPREEVDIHVVAAARQEAGRDQALGIPVRAAEERATGVEDVEQVPARRLAFDPRDLVAEDPGMAAADAAVLILAQAEARRQSVRLSPGRATRSRARDRSGDR